MVYLVAKYMQLLYLQFMSRSACVWQEQFWDERHSDVLAPLARLRQWMPSHWFTLTFFIAWTLLFCTNYGFSEITAVSVFFLSFSSQSKLSNLSTRPVALDSILNISASQFSQQHPGQSQHPPSQDADGSCPFILVSTLALIVLHWEATGSLP